MTKTPTFKTRIDLKPDLRRQMIDLLNQQLADTFDLYSLAKQAHWNVKGGEFFQLHKLFDDLAEVLAAYIDQIAERVTALGGTATGTVRMSAAATRLKELPLATTADLEVVDALADAFAAVAKSTREGISTSTDADDLATADLLSEVSRGMDKSLWFLEAHLQAATGKGEA